MSLFSGEAVMESNDGKFQASEVSASQHVLVCALHELGSLVQRLGSSASPLVAEPAAGKLSIRIAAYRISVFILLHRLKMPLVIIISCNGCYSSLIL